MVGVGVLIVSLCLGVVIRFLFLARIDRQIVESKRTRPRNICIFYIAQFLVRVLTRERQQKGLKGQKQESKKGIWCRGTKVGVRK